MPGNANPLFSSFIVNFDEDLYVMQKVFQVITFKNFNKRYQQIVSKLLEDVVP